VGRDFGDVVSNYAMSLGQTGVNTSSIIRSIEKAERRGIDGKHL
jgi:hypothetical protein